MNSFLTFCKSKTKRNLLIFFFIMYMVMVPVLPAQTAQYIGTIVSFLSLIPQFMDKTLANVDAKIDIAFLAKVNSANSLLKTAIACRDESSRKALIVQALTQSEEARYIYGKLFRDNDVNLGTTEQFLRNGAGISTLGLGFLVWDSAGSAKALKNLKSITYLYAYTTTVFVSYQCHKYLGTPMNIECDLDTFPSLDTLSSDEKSIMANIVVPVKLYIENTFFRILTNPLEQEPTFRYFLAFPKVPGSYEMFKEWLVNYQHFALQYGLVKDIKDIEFNESNFKEIIKNLVPLKALQEERLIACLKIGLEIDKMLKMIENISITPYQK